MAEETGKSADGIRQRIYEGGKLYKEVQLSELTGTSKHAHKTEPEEIPLVALGEKEILAIANRIKSEKKNITRETKKVETEAAQEEVLTNLETSFDIRG